MRVGSFTTCRQAGTAVGCSGGSRCARTFRQGAEHVARGLLGQPCQLRRAVEEAHHQPHAARLQRRFEVGVRQRLRAALLQAPVVRPARSSDWVSIPMQAACIRYKQPSCRVQR